MQPKFNCRKLFLATTLIKVILKKHARLATVNNLCLAYTLTVIDDVGLYNDHTLLLFTMIVNNISSNVFNFFK